MAILELEASNIGRLAVGMEDVKALTDHGDRLSLTQWDANLQRGTSLDGGHRASWYSQLTLLQRFIDARYREPVKCWLELTLGNGKKVRTRECIVLEPQSPAMGAIVD